MSKPSTAFLDAARAEDLQDLLSHIAWSDTLRPALLREREAFTKLLVSATLGAPIEVATRSGGIASLTKEQLAGKIYGIDYILDLIERVLSKGTRALDELQSRGINIK